MASGTHSTTPNFSCKSWGSNSGPHACKACALLTGSLYSLESWLRFLCFGWPGVSQPLEARNPVTNLGMEPHPLHPLTSRGRISREIIAKTEAWCWLGAAPYLDGNCSLFKKLKSCSKCMCHHKHSSHFSGYSMYWKCD